MQAAYQFRRHVFAWLRLRTRGVKVMLFNDAGELLLIRNTYGNRELFVLPGGGVGRRESTRHAAVREIKEELGIEVTGLTLIGTYQSGAEGKRDTIHLFKANGAGQITHDPLEIEEAQYFNLDEALERGSPATVRRIQEVCGKQPIDGRW